MHAARPLAFLGLSAALLTALLLSYAGQPAASLSAAHAHPPPLRVDPDDPAALADLIDRIADRRVIFIGETHDRYDHHHNQLAVIRALYARGIPVAIGMEQFQRPFQRELDAFVAGAIDERALLRRTEWDERWRFDIRLYRDILAFARQEGLPLVALNAASETVRQVSAGGIDSLSAAERALFPHRIELGGGAYGDYLEAVMHMHHDLPPARRQRFLEVQYTWDQTMARSAADYLIEHPLHSLVILVGSGHVLHDEAIPARLRALYPAAQAVLVTDSGWLPPGANPEFIFAARDLQPDPTDQVAARDDE